MNKRDAAKANRVKAGDRVRISLAGFRNRGEYGTVTDASDGRGIKILLDSGEPTSADISHLHKVYE